MAMVGNDSLSTMKPATQIFRSFGLGDTLSPYEKLSLRSLVDPKDLNNCQGLNRAGGGSVAVCVCTRRRPKMLRACLDSLTAQVPPKGWTITLVVVENDDSPRCIDIVEEARKGAPYSVEYVNEVDIGIPMARNAAIAASRALEAEWIAFIDDDEVAEPDWLVQLCGRAGQPGVDVIQGPSRYEYPSETPDWLPRRPLAQRKNGESLRTAATNNVMFRRVLTEESGFGLRFDPRFRFTGGEDSDFFTRATERGGRIVWEQSAVVLEIVPQSRLRIGWQLKRAFRVATNASEGELLRSGFTRTFIKRTPKNLLRLMRGAALSPLVLLWPLGAPFRRLAFTAMKSCASGLGGFAGLTPFRIEPYRAIEGE
jgi:succinoglycan biosynthesis protein ExoM